MMKFQLSLLLALSFLVTSIAPTYAHVVRNEEKISRVFDEFHYAMNVEWDQEDPVFKDEAQRTLEENLKTLEAEGISPEDIKWHMIQTVLDGKAQQEFLRLVEAAKAQNLSEEKITELAMTFVGKNYHEGANFTGKGKGGSVGGLPWKWIVCVVVVVVIIKCFQGQNDTRQIVYEGPVYY